MVKADITALKSVSPAMKARADAFGGAYRAASANHAVLRNWNPSGRSPHAALRMDRERLGARIHDLTRNNGWASAATSRFLDSIVGKGFRLSARPHAAVLGITAEQAEEVADQIEALWLEYTEDPRFWADAERASSVAALDGLAVRHMFADGECFGWLGWREGASLFSTVLQVIDPARVSNPNNTFDTATLRDGVVLDSYGAWTGVHVRSQHPGDEFVPGRQAWKWEYFPRETEWGRPVILHLRDRQWAGMSRSASDLAPVTLKLRQVETYDEAEIDAAVLNAKLAAFVQTTLDPDTMDDPEKVAAYAQSEQDYYQRMPIELEGVSLGFLHPGSTINTVKAEHPNSNFEAFERNVLRNIASAAGMTYEAMTADFSQANYSSIRASLVEFRKGFARKAAVFAAQWRQPHYMAWLEEVFDKRLIALPAGAPSFEAAPVAWSMARWTGPGTGWVDPEKEAKAASIRLALGLTTKEDEIAAQGGDWKATAQQRAREQAFEQSLGLPPADQIAVAAQSPSGNVSGDGEQEAQ